MAKMQDVDGVMTLPINKKAWELTGVKYKGHTDALRDFFFANAIMMLGVPNMFVALYTEHIPLKEVASKIDEKNLTRFLIDFYNSIKPDSTIAVLGLNPHAGDNGVLGDEEKIITNAIDRASKIIREKEVIDSNHLLFSNPLVPDIAFTPNMRKNYKYFIAMYHDQGLIPLKALYFDEGINISLNLPIIRTSVDHGTAFDIAYQKKKLNNLSYINAINYFITT
jgi:4-hydroxythreonine-4-phosphate dehydrogenase